VEEEKVPFNPLRGFGKKNGMPQEKAGRDRYLEPKQLGAVLEKCPGSSYCRSASSDWHAA